MKNETTKGFDVFRNGQLLGFVSGQNKKTRIEVIKKLVTHTHMGQWVKTDKGFEYCTTTGCYILFNPCKRVSNMISNYRIEGL